MHDFISKVIIVALLVLRVLSQQNLPNDVMLSGRVRISDINLAFYHGAIHDQGSLLSTFEDDICLHFSQHASPTHAWGFQCSLETFNPATSFVTIRLSTPRENWLSMGMPSEDSFVKAYVGITLSHYARPNALINYQVPMPNSLVILLCTALTTTTPSSDGYRSRLIRSNPSFLELQRDFCSVIESLRESDSSFRNIGVECGVISLNPPRTMVELYLMINNNDLENARISRDKNAIALAVQNAFGQAVFRHKGVTFGWQIVDPPSGKVPTYFLLRGGMLRSGQPLQFDSEQQAAESQYLGDLIENICNTMEARGNLAVIYPDRTFKCQFKRYNKETFDVTIFVTVRGFDYATTNQLQEALSLSSLSIQSGDISYDAQIVNHENLAPRQTSNPLEDYHMIIILSTVNALHYDLQSKDSVIDAFHQINGYVCDHLHPQLGLFTNVQCKVISFDPVTRKFKAQITIPVNQIERSGIEVEEIHFELTNL